MTSKGAGNGADVSNGGSPSLASSEDEHFDGVTRDSRQGLLKTFANAIGFDITTIALPVTVNEPLSFLMRLCETYQFTELLDKANLCEDFHDRLMYVGAFVVSLYGSAERTGKPFNPLLGETYELVDPKRRNLRFVAEQVSHHPPIGASHCENDNFILTCDQRVKTKFTGNTLECYAIGHSGVTLKRTNETFTWTLPVTYVHNLIVGSMWLEHCGVIDVLHTGGEEKCHLVFERCGWFSKGWREVTGTLLDARGHTVAKMFGKYNMGMFRMKPGQKPEDVLLAKSASSESLTSSSSSSGSSEGSPDDSPREADKSSDRATQKKLEKQAKADKKAQEKEEKKIQKLIKKGEARDTVWRNPNKPVADVPNKYLEGWTAHSFYVAAVPEQAVLPPTDSRLRADRVALEKGDTKTAASAKFRLEQKQREEKRLRGDKEWVPRYFRKVPDSKGEDMWVFNGTYWQEREERQKSLRANESKS